MKHTTEVENEWSYTSNPTYIMCAQGLLVNTFNDSNCVVGGGSNSCSKIPGLAFATILCVYVVVDFLLKLDVIIVKTM